MKGIIIPLSIGLVTPLGGLHSKEYNQPNIVFIMADDLGWADLSLRSDYYAPPNINGLASQGCFFANAYAAAANSAPSRACFIEEGMFKSRVGKKNNNYTID